MFFGKKKTSLKFRLNGYFANEWCNVSFQPLSSSFYASFFLTAKYKSRTLCFWQKLYHKCFSVIWKQDTPRLVWNPTTQVAQPMKAKSKDMHLDAQCPRPSTHPQGDAIASKNLFFWTNLLLGCNRELQQDNVGFCWHWSCCCAFASEMWEWECSNKEENIPKERS